MYNFSIELKKLFCTLIIFFIFFSIKKVFHRGVEQFGKRNHFSLERILRTKRFIDFFVCIITLSLLLLVWGVKPKEFFLITATAFTIIGTACFASWSNLSNISSGIILFFNCQLKLGDCIKIGSKDDAVVGIVKDMKVFYVEILTEKKELLLYPNNMMLHQPITILKKVEIH